MVDDGSVTRTLGCLALKGVKTAEARRLDATPEDAHGCTSEKKEMPLPDGSERVKKGWQMLTSVPKICQLRSICGIKVLSCQIIRSGRLVTLLDSVIHFTVNLFLPHGYQKPYSLPTTIAVAQSS